jgi:hypothetical protein
MVIDCFPVFVWGGAALLGRIGGELFVTDPYLHHMRPPGRGSEVEWRAAIVGAAQHTRRDGAALDLRHAFAIQRVALSRGSA